MPREFTPLAALDEDALGRLADLHLQVMHTLLSELGRPFVLRYYQAARSEPGFIGLCAVNPQGEIEGWAAGSPDPAGLTARLRQPAAWFAGRMLALLFTRPSALVSLAGSVLGASQANAPTAGQIELTYIGVAPAAQGKGLGAELLQAFCQASTRAGHRSVVLSVETGNQPALSLYTRAGFQVTHTFREGRFERMRMLLPLARPANS